MSIETRQNETWTALILLLAALFTLAVAAALDYVLYRLQLHSQRTFIMQPFLLALSGVKFVIAALLVGLTWLTHRRLAPSVLAGILLMLLGAVATFYPVLTFVVGLGDFLPFAVRLSTGSHFPFAGAFVTVLGFYELLRSVRAEEAGR